MLYTEYRGDTHYGRNVRPSYHSNKRVSVWEIYDIPGAEILAVKSTGYSDRSNGHRQDALGEAIVADTAAASWAERTSETFSSVDVLNRRKIRQI